MICTGNNYNTNIDQQAMESKSADNFFGEIFQISNYFRKGKEGEGEKIQIKKIEIKTKKGGREVENADPVDLPPRRSLTDPPKIGGCSSHDSTASAIPLPSPCRRCFAAGRKIECEHGRSICPKESLIFGRCPPTIFVLVENYISPRRTVLSRGARGGGPPHIIIPIGPL